MHIHKYILTLHTHTYLPGGGGDDPQNTEEGRGKRESTGYVTPSSDPTLTFKYYGIQRVVVKKKESG